MKTEEKLKISHIISLIILGIFVGIMLMSFWQSQFSAEKMAKQQNLIPLMWFGFCVLVPTIFIELYKRTIKIIKCLGLNDSTAALFGRYHVFTYAIFLAYGLVLIGIKPYLSFILLIFILFALEQVFLLWLLADKPQKERWFNSLDVIPELFFVSGFAALIYQVIWQRVLFTTFGSNIESVTVIVAIFMFGLGIGSLVGGQVQKYFPNRLLEYFVGVEIAIAIFGVLSIPLIETIGAITPRDSLPALIGVTFALLALPTILMGSTLPLLVSYLHRRHPNLGAVVGKLYAYNTLGSAFASFLTVMLLFTALGRQSSLAVAALCNIATAYMVWSFCKQNKGNYSSNEHKDANVSPSQNNGGLTYGMALLLSSIIGYASLSLEILWFRIIGFMTANLPQVFGTLLAVFLVGIAYGSLKAKSWSEAGKDVRVFVSRSLILMVVTAYISVPLVGLISSFDQTTGIGVGYIAIGLLALFSGGIFPLLCQMGINNVSSNKSGLAVSWVYFFNIIGATSGSLITGFVLLNEFDLGLNILIVCVIIVFAIALLSRVSLRNYVLCAAAIAGALLLQPVIYENIIFNLQGLNIKNGVFKHISENRHGIITVVESKKKGDIIYGNGAYDGRYNIDPIVDGNDISRAYMLAALHPNPKRILEIGLSSGSWARVFTMYKPLDKMVSIEINPGYIGMIEKYPEISPLLQSPKWIDYIDDGRRWLTNHPDERFDAIVMNTTYYWRNNASNLLSREFLELCKRHLNDGGIVYYNTTEARDNIYTAAHVFKHVVQFHSMVAASDQPFSMSYEEKNRNLLGFNWDNGKVVFANDNEKYAQMRENLAKYELEDIRDKVLSEKGLWLITDDNMSSEYKIEHSFLPANWR